jgi:PAS domain S-box-containing protein
MSDLVPNPDDERSLSRDGAERSRLTGILEIIGSAIALGAVLPILHNALYGRWRSVAVLLVAEAGVLLALALNRRGRLDTAIGVVVATLQVCAGALVVVGRHGFHDVALLIFPATLVVAGLLLSRRAFAGVTAATILFVVGLGVAELRGILVTPQSAFIEARNLADVVIILGITAVAVSLLAESVRTSLARARRNEATVEAANAELVKQAQCLQASEERIRSLIDLAVDGILIGDAQGRVTGVNRRMQELTGLSAEELAGRALGELFSPEKQRRAPLRRDLVQQGETAVAERLLLRADGSTVPVEMSSKRMPDGTFHSFFRDVTERRRAQEEKERLQDELRQAQKMEAVGRLAGGIAHDFNNMLMAIGSSVTVALRDLEPGSRAHRCLLEVDRASGRAGALTRQLLAFSRKQDIAPRVLDLGALVENLRPMLAGIVGADVALHIVNSGRPSLVQVDAGQMEQAVLNLAMNARDAMPAGGRLTLGASHVDLGAERALALGLEPGPHVALTVADTGTGMTPDVLQRLFEPFFTTKPSGKGTGLGLAMVYGAVKQNRGAIDVESLPGRGTTFRLFFPRAAEDHRNVPGGPHGSLLASTKA